MPRVKTISDVAVLDLALDVLLERGPHRFKLPDVARAVGLSASTLVQRFGSKAGLLAAVLTRSTETLESALDALPETDDPRSDLIAWMVALARPLQTREHVASNLALLIDDLTRDAERMAAGRHMQAVRDGIEHHLRAMGSRTLAADVAMVEAHWHGLVIQWALGGDGAIDEWIARGLGALLDRIVPGSQ